MAKRAYRAVNRLSYSPELVAPILEQLAEGKSLSEICRAASPRMSTIFEWLDQHPEFADRYARAREQQAEKLAGDIIKIADNPKLDPNDKRIRVDARKWVASKLKPKTYGDKIDMNLSGSVALTSDQRQARIDALLAKRKRGDE